MDIDGGSPRLIALDVDGTLLKTGAPVTDRVVAAVRSAVAAGSQVVVSTGRTVMTTRPVLDQLGLVRGHAVCSNGAVQIDIEAAEPVGVHSFDPLPAVTALRELFPDMIFTAEQVGKGFWATGMSPGEYYPGGEYVVVDYETLCSVPTPRLNCWWPEGSVTEMRRLLETLAVPDISWVYGEFGPWLTISREGVSKGWALERLRRTLDIPREATLAIGDGFNDREMFAWAGRSVAMANAPTELHAVVDEVTADVTADGVAAVLERWF
ncbi:HAD family hydrolase [Nocardia carnea]|uniref:HAD family hydrolase n=1 Tax=Nocardia carnea TaxID=37328 RepID=UPI0024568D96|nr:HAD family hydrolase [Nocardia carnea]